ncbi:hypothetical protein Pflav_022310 [Phytohabitans flavus]|uniref:Uncharacterized protein n=1 Tax=Phytohabitans flavus TaxID=1076124 RepID=A0A6F8XQ01_9ACTN|nr:hypothetical protein [Phytohabitans flavus]BCB75821.1 hypothetical protein Pflav_022310 [Phytohabitans flavus]
MDGWTVAVGPASGLDATLVRGSFDLAELQSMYNAGTPQTASDGFTYDPVDVSNPLDTPAPGSTAIHLLVPPLGSATRSLFAGAMGFNSNSPPPWVKDTYTPTGGGATQQVQDNDGTAVAQDRNALMPYNTTQWLAQMNHPAIDRRNGARLQNIGTLSPFDATGLRFNTSFHFPLLRGHYNVIPFAATTAGPGTGYLNYLWRIFVDTNSASPLRLCNYNNIITSWGFGVLAPGRCGLIDPALRAYDVSRW